MSSTNHNPPPTYNEATASSATGQPPQPSPQSQDHKPSQSQQQQHQQQQGQPLYQAIVIERSMHVTPVLSRRMERQFPLAALFFILGWICPPVWIVGACCCLGSIHPYEAWWASVNLYMAITFIFASIIYSMIVIANQI